MKSLLVRNVSDQTWKTLKAMARQNRRSLQGELHALLDGATRPKPRLGTGFTLKTVRTSHSGNWSRSEIYED